MRDSEELVEHKLCSLDPASGQWRYAFPAREYSEHLEQHFVVRSATHGRARLPYPDEAECGSVFAATFQLLPAFDHLRRLFVEDMCPSNIPMALREFCATLRQHTTLLNRVDEELLVDLVRFWNEALDGKRESESPCEVFVSEQWNVFAECLADEDFYLSTDDILLTAELT